MLKILLAALVGQVPLPEDSFSIASFNVFGPPLIVQAPRRFAIIAETIRESSFDVVALQEVTAPAARAAIPLSDYTALWGAPATGLVLLVRGEASVLARGAFEHQAPPCDGVLPVCQTKGYLVARVERADGSVFHVVNVHLAIPAATAALQWRELRRVLLIKGALSRLVLVGDMNRESLACLPAIPGLLDIAPAPEETTHGHALTGLFMPSLGPRRLDHVFISPDLAAVPGSANLVFDAPVDGVSLSDHRGVSVSVKAPL